MRRTIILVAVVFATLAAARTVIAAPQSKRSATLSGVVLGPDDKPVAHASVSYQSSGGNAPHAVYTDSRGRFTITTSKSDNYDVRASSKGVFSEWVKNITLRKGKTEYITLQLIYAREMPKATKTSKPKQ
jgi:hypothetical protein